MADIKVFTLYFDGACGPKNPGGTAAYGFTLHLFAAELARGNAVIGTGPNMTNNVAEYYALCEGLAAFLQKYAGGFARLVVRGDSQLVVKQMSGEWKAKSGLYFPYYEKAKVLCSTIRKKGAQIVFEWIPRESNTQCDELSKAHINYDKMSQTRLTAG